MLKVLIALSAEMSGVLESCGDKTPHFFAVKRFAQDFQMGFGFIVTLVIYLSMVQN
jgi:hypothetical protein